MAEYKLGRIRFVWKGAWNTSTTYYKDDVVSFGGRTYICSVGHSASADFYTDLDYSPTRWNLFTDGQEWKGEWATSTSYKEKDIVKYGGLLYICNDGHVSASTTVDGLENDSGKWDLFTEGFDWKGDWTVNTRYKANDLVKYGGYTYVCTTHHTSAATASLGLEADSGKWQIFNAGLEYEGTWVGSGTRYRVNDIVKYGANLWICTTQHSSSAAFVTDSANWSVFVEGFEFEEDWSNVVVYQPGDIVRYGGNQYVAKTNHSGATPSTSTTNWALFSEGFNFVSDWSGVTAYRIGDVIRLNGYTYLATADNTNQEPPNASYWTRLNSGIYWRGEWQNSTAYKLGDAVLYGKSSYICVQAHTSADDDSAGTTGDAALSPETDSSGSYWNVLAVGSESDVLTTKGDLVYYGGAGPTRLPIGIEGQVLRSNGDEPEWVTLETTDFVYYVAPHGTDLPAPIHGKSKDKPFKTIRYACEQVLKGPRNPDAQYLLELNRVFIQREVSEWIRYQVDNADVGSIWENFDFDEYKCERDVGFIVDRIIHDIGHGGNLKTRAAALSFVGGLGDDGEFSAPEEDVPYVTLSSEKEQGVAAYNYMLTVIENVLDNEAPAVNYQVTNGDNSTSIVSQYINPALTAETGVYTTIQGLVGIVTTALTDGDSDNIPARSVPSNLILVATGTYTETLPIIVPAFTCVKGDELRSTLAGPAGSLIDPSDAFFTVDTFGHISGFIGDIVTGTTVTPTSGNTETQSQAWPFATAVESTEVEKLIDVMKHRVDFKLNTMHLANLTDPTNYNTSYLNGYGNARKLIKENKKFFQEEVIAYLTANYSTLKWQKTLTRRDVGYIVDAIVYDLTYDGNALSVQAGLAYYDGDDNTQPQISDSIKSATIASQTFLKSLMQAAAQNIAITPLQDTIVQFRDTAGSAAAATAIGNNIDDIIEIVNTGPAAVGTTVTLVDPTPSNGVNSTTTLINEYNLLEGGDDFDQVKDVVEAYLAANYSDVDYSVSKSRRDAGIVLKAIGFDMMFNSNYQTLKAAHAYLRPTSSELFDTDDRIKEATRNALLAARDEALSIISDSTAEARLTALYKIVDDVIYGGSNESNICQTQDRVKDWAILQLERNRDFIVAEVSAYVEGTYQDTVTGTTSATKSITISDTSWLTRNAAIVFTGDTTFGDIVRDQTYYVQNILSSTTFTIAETRNAATPFNISDGSGTLSVNLVYDSALCLRDVGTYIDALKYDLRYPGNFKSRFVARYYTNAVTGSLEEDMFYLRDGTGIRDMTLQGLSGDLTPENAYGTSRTTAGAYCSLDPGWGPTDFTTWILSRSPYIQGVTTLGNAAIGQKIDGALHNGGNDSMVSNDFTQLISDGIGAWVTNNGRAELVSVFTYYSHIGYLSENGGRIRGTNGNNSYGDFGSVAEGFDTSETPNTAIVDNKFQFEATVGSVITSGTQILKFEFDNAGIDYSEITWTITGGGTGADAEGDEFRDDGVYQVRLLDLGDDSSGQFGGDGYITNSNTAQGGSSTSITLAQTDPVSSTQYIGMKIVVTGGSGAGQFGLVSTYNSGTKIASVIRESTGVAGWDHMVPGTAIVSPDASSTYTVEPAISFTSPGFDATGYSLPSSGTWNDVKHGSTVSVVTGLTGTYSGSTGSGAQFTVIRNGYKYEVSITNGGTNYVRLETITIAGTSLGGATPTNDLVITITSVNSTTGAIQAFDQEGRGCSGNFVAVKSASAAGAYSADGVTWTAMSMPSSADWISVTHGLIDDGSSVAKMSMFVAVANGSDKAAYSEDGITWTASTLPVSANWVAVTYGEGRFVAVADDSTTVAISLDGIVWDLSGTLTSTGFSDVTYGKGLFVAIKAGTTIASTSTNGVSWTDRTLPASDTWSSVTWGDGAFVAVASDSNDGAISVDGITWAAITLGSPDGSSTAGFQKVRYGQGLFMATTYLAGEAGEGYSYVMTSEDGVNWDSKGLPEYVSPGTGGYNALAFGRNPSHEGKWVVIQYTSGDYFVSVSTGATAKARAFVAENKIFAIRITEPGSGYATAPTMTITDPNNVYEVPFAVRIGKGVLANPSFVSRGSGYSTGSAEVNTGDGYADFYQSGSFVAVRQITESPVAGSNVVFGHLPNTTFKLVSVLTLRGTFDGSYTAFFQISPTLSISEAPENGTSITTRIRYSQVRLTGHDFLDIGTGSFAETNYPGVPTQEAIQANETVESNGGRVFFTATDQDGNFRVGDLFSIEQSTGIATLNADAFNISGLQELNLGNVTLGGGSATITEFSTDPFFTADSDNIVPTQRAIKAYIASQIGGGGASLNVNSVTAGSIFISSNEITTTTGGAISMNATFDFRGGITGVPLAFNYFLNK